MDSTSENGEKQISRRNALGLLKKTAIAGAALATGIVGLNEIKKKASQTALERIGDPREGGEIVELKLLSIQSENQKPIEPVIRKSPLVSGDEIDPEEILGQGINVRGVLRGKAVWGGTYPSVDNRGLVRTDSGTNRGKWFEIVSDEGKTVGFVSGNFVSVQPKEQK